MQISQILNPRDERVCGTAVCRTAPPADLDNTATVVYTEGRLQGWITLNLLNIPVH